MIGRAKLACAPLLVVAALLLPATSQAAGPSDLLASHSQRFITATWTPPAGRVNHFIEIATDLGFANVVEHKAVGGADTGYTSSVQRTAGTYYVRVAVSDPLCVTACVDEFSNIATIVLPQSPTNLAVTQVNGILHATWNLPPGWWSGVLCVSPTSDFDQDGFFTDANAGCGAPPIDAPVTTFVAPGTLPPGIWYVNVSGYDPNCIDPRCDPEQFSSIASITIPAPVHAPPPPSQSPPPPPPVVADKITSFSALKCASTQKAGNLVVQASMPENGTITAGGTLNVPNAAKVFKLKATSVSAPAGKTVKVTLKLPSKVLKAVKKALKKHRKVKANLTITAKDAAGNTKTEKRAVSLKG